MSYADKVLAETLRDILENGCSTVGMEVRPRWEDGTPAHTIKQFAVVNRYDLRKEFPLITVRPVDMKKCIDEILWIWQKHSNNVNMLNSHIWDSWADENGCIGKTYGYQMGKEMMLGGQKRNQVEWILDTLIKNPMDRRIMSNMFVHADLDEMNLPPCVYSCTFNVTIENGQKVLNMLLNQRSQDMMVANGWNVAQYAALQMMIARHVGMVAGRLTHVIADCHLYDRHVEFAKELISRYDNGLTYAAPTVTLNPEKTNFWEFTPDDFIIEGYKTCPQIKHIPVAV